MMFDTGVTDGECHGDQWLKKVFSLSRFAAKVSVDADFGVSNCLDILGRDLDIVRSSVATTEALDPRIREAWLGVHVSHLFDGVDFRDDPDLLPSNVHEEFTFVCC